MLVLVVMVANRPTSSQQATSAVTTAPPSTTVPPVTTTSTVPSTIPAHDGTEHHSHDLCKRLWSDVLSRFELDEHELVRAQGGQQAAEHETLLTGLDECRVSLARNEHPVGGHGGAERFQGVHAAHHLSQQHRSQRTTDPKESETP